MSESEAPKLYPQPSNLAAYANAGWSFVRLHHYSEKKTIQTAKGPKVIDLGKAPIGKGWTKQGIPLDAAIAHMNTGRNVGGLIPPQWGVIDVDPRNMPVERRQTILQEFQQRASISLSTLPHVITGAGGRHFFVRVPAGYKGSVHHPDFPGIEFKQIGVQVVTAGSIHPVTLHHYKWGENIPTLEEASVAPEALLTIFKIEIPSGAGNVQAAGSWASLTEEQFESGLGKLDPTNFRDQDDWFGLMCSAHWLTGGTGLAAFAEWSTSDPEYADHEEIITMRWDSLSRGSDSTQLVARGGLFFKALKAVGVNPADAEWQIQPEKDFYDYDEEEYATDQGKIDLKQQASMDKAAKTQGGILEQLNERHFVLNHKGKTVVGRISKDEDDHGAEITVYTFSDVGSFKNYYANQFMKAAGSADPVPIAEWWFQHPSRLTYAKMEFRPDRTPGAYRDNEGLVLNQWTGWAIQPKPGDWSYFQDLLFHTICHEDEAKYTYLLNWFAYSYQNFDGPIGTAVCINGLKGTGKTTVWEIFSAPFGSSHAMSTSRMEELFGDFNGRMMGKSALLIEEALFAASKAANNILKDWITGSKVAINEKFLPAYTQRNYMRIMIFTNSDHIVEATEDERRFYITRALPNRKDDEVFWKALRAQMFENGGTQAFFHDMLQRDITNFDPQFDCPVTRELAEQIGLTRGAVVDWLIEKFDFGEGQFSYAWRNKKNEFILPINEMWSDFSHWQGSKARGRFTNPLQSQSAFSRELKRIYQGLDLTTGSVPDSLDMEIKSFESVVKGRVYKIAKVYRFHTYEEFYAEFAKKYGLAVYDYDPSSDGEGEDDPDFAAVEEENWDII